MVMWSQTIHDLLPEPLLVCCSGQPRPTLPQERDFAVKTPAVSAGCLQYKHSQGSQREVGWLWEQNGTAKTGEHGGSGRGSGTAWVREGEADSFSGVLVKLWAVQETWLIITIRADYKLCKKQVLNRHIVSVTLRWRCLSVLHHLIIEQLLEHKTVVQKLTKPISWMWSMLHTM